MSMRIQVIASHTGMSESSGSSADVYEVLSVERMEGFLAPAESELDLAPPVSSGPLTELRGVQLVSGRIARAADLDGLLRDALEALDETLGFSHSMILVPDDDGDTLVTIATRGYGVLSVGACLRATSVLESPCVATAAQRSRWVAASVPRVSVGDGTIGTAAEHRRMIKVTGMGSEPATVAPSETGSRSAATRHVSARRSLCRASRMPRRSCAAAPRTGPTGRGDRRRERGPTCVRRVGRSVSPVLANQIALGIDRMQEIEEQDSEDEHEPAARAGEHTSAHSGGVVAMGVEAIGADAVGAHAVGAHATGAGAAETKAPGPGATRHVFVYYPNDDCVSSTGSISSATCRERSCGSCSVSIESGRTEFTNRELGSTSRSAFLR
ncbi:MAG: hypothetical protein R3E97_01580 [Candidatus Eisenbacteria bacterium]